MNIRHEPNPDVNRELLFVGGPLDGESRWQPKAFWPVGTYYPDPESRNAGVWCGDTVPIDRSRGRYVQHPERPCQATPVHMLWISSADPDEVSATANVPAPYDPGDYCRTCGVALSQHGEDCRIGDLL